MSHATDADDRVSNFGYFLRFVMRKKRLRAPQVGTLMDWTAAYVEKLTYGTEDPPGEGDVERLIAALRCDRLEGDALRLFSSKKGGYVELRRQADERTAEVFEKNAELEETQKEIAALKSEVAALKAEAARLKDSAKMAALADTKPLAGGSVPKAKAAQKLDADQISAIDTWARLRPAEREVVQWLAATGMMARVCEIVEAARKPK